jgi:hypothetical protein
MQRGPELHRNVLAEVPHRRHLLLTLSSMGIQLLVAKVSVLFVTETIKSAAQVTSLPVARRLST